VVKLDDTAGKAVGRFGGSRARLAIASHWRQKGQRWRLKKATRQEGLPGKETKAESTLPQFAGRQAGSSVQRFDRRSARSHPQRWLPESCSKLASKGNFVTWKRLSGQQSESGGLDKVCPAGRRRSDFGRHGQQEPTESFEDQDQVDRVSCKPREQMPSPGCGSLSGI
jgi:hypothetical protein